MTSEAHETTAVSTPQPSATPLQIAYAVALVGAGMLATFALIYGITHGQSGGGSLWFGVGAISYFAVWGWGLRLAASD